MGLEEILKELGSDIPFDENGDLTPDGQWIIEARRTSLSATQGNISIFVNSKDMDMHFEDKIELDKNGNYVSTTPDSELGKFVYACLWHPLDKTYHYSDRFKRLFKPNWKDKE